MPAYLFYILAAAAVACAVMVVCFRNPVASALAMVGSFVGVAALFIGLDAFFVGIIQILVYAGAIMVLFLFIIMLLDLKSGEQSRPRLLPAVAAIALAVVLLVQLAGVLGETRAAAFPPLDLATAAEDFGEGTAIRDSLAPAADSGREAALPDVHLLGHTIFTRYNLEMQIVGVLLLVATVGVVVLSRRQTPSPDSESTQSSSK